MKVGPVCFLKSSLPIATPVNHIEYQGSLGWSGWVSTLPPPAREEKREREPNQLIGRALEPVPKGKMCDRKRKSSAVLAMGELRN